MSKINTNYNTGDILTAEKMTEVKNSVNSLYDQIGVANGIASLNNSGKIPDAQLPSLADVATSGDYNDLINKSIIPEDNTDIVEFFPEDTWGRFIYTKSWAVVYEGTYIFELDCYIYSGTPTIQIQFGSLTKIFDADCYNPDLKKYIITIEKGSTEEAHIKIMIGNASNSSGSHFICANPKLYYNNENLINPFNQSYYTNTSTETPIANTWNRRSAKYNFICKTNGELTWDTFPIN